MNKLIDAILSVSPQTGDSIVLTVATVCAVVAGGLSLAGVI